MLKLWPGLLDRLLLLAALTVAFGGFWVVAGLVGFPHHRGFNASVLLQPMPTAMMLTLAVGLLVAVAIGTMLAGRVRYDAGWACAVLGLSAWRLRGGTIEHVLAGRGSGAFVTLATELLILGLMAGGAWALLHLLRERGTASRALRRVLELPDARTRDLDRKATAESLDQKLLAAAIGATTMIVLMIVLCQTSDRAQVIFAVAVSAYLATWITHSFIPTRPGAWFWSAPVLCGIVAYLWAAWGRVPAQINIGEPGGLLANAARPLPLDYIAIGVPAALWRYVQSRTSQAQQVAAAQATPVPVA